MKHKLLALALLAAIGVAHAESNPAKKELVSKLLQLQQASVEGTARMLTDQPALQLLQKVAPIVQFQVPPDKREALAKDIQGDLKKYVDDVGPLLRERATKLAPSTVGTLLEEKLSEDELRQIISFLESPAQRKYQQLAPEINKALTEKLLAETRSQIEPKLKSLDEGITKRIKAALPASK